MSSYTDEGVVLRRIDYAEADRILTVLTREHGKIGVIARGVRKAPGRMAPHTDLFARSSMHIARGRGELEVLTQAQRVGPALPSSDARRVACASLCAELADRVLEGNHPLEQGIYELVADALEACADPARDPRSAVAWFARRMIDRLGYAPELTVCASCASSLPEEPAVFSAAGGGLLCARCAMADPGGVECPVRVIKVLRVIASADADLYARLRLDAQTLVVLELVVERELAQHVDRRLRSLEVLRAVF
ncbi:MAG TPA: DNA repair protein RecO [Candidatus Dormibacteraeota bacterium]|nr:DNA repair protein RecO [Candidatus Dormibacteraeota bacterium]